MNYVKYSVIVLFLCVMGYGGYKIYQQNAVSYYKAAPIIAPASISPRSEPIGGTGPTSAEQSDHKELPPPPSTKVDVAGLIKIEMPEVDSWDTTLKLLLLIIGSAFGVKVINTTFKRFE